MPNKPEKFAEAYSMSYKDIQISSKQELPKLPDPRKNSTGHSCARYTKYMRGWGS